MRNILILKIAVLALLFAGNAGAHPDASSANFVDCAKTIAKKEPGMTFPIIGVMNTCNFPVVGVVCTVDKREGKVRRYGSPVNLPAGESYTWILYDPDNVSAVNSYACRQDARCFSGPDAHDPHCF